MTKPARRNRGEILPSPERRGLNREESATYCGLGATKFDELVKDGRMPKPVEIDGRRIWDRAALDRAFDRLAATVVRDEDPNPWNEVLSK